MYLDLKCGERYGSYLQESDSQSHGHDDHRVLLNQLHDLWEAASYRLREEEEESDSKRG